MGCLYIIEGPKNYIGITSKGVADRWECHVRQASRKSPARSYLYRAMKKHGIDKFSIRVLVVSNDWEYLCELEHKAIALFGTKSPSGYNSTDGGDGVIGLDDETKTLHRKNTSDGTKAAWDNGGLREARAAAFARPETKKKMSDATKASMTRLFQTEEYREKIRAARRKPEYRAAVSASVKRLWDDPEYRAAMVIRRQSRKPRTAESIARQSEKMKALIAERKANGTYKHGSQWTHRKRDC